MSDLDDLPEPVRDALILLPCMASSEAEDMAVSAVEAELLRLSSRAKELERENADVRSRCNVFVQSTARFRDDAARAELELAALKARIAEAPTAIIRRYAHSRNSSSTVLTNFQSAAVAGLDHKRVALLDMGKEG